MEKLSISQLEDTCSQVRRDILRMVHAVQSGHPGGSLGCTEFFVALYFNQMRHSPDFNMDGIGEDLLFLSNGHISPVWYSVLARSGYFGIDELKTFRKIDSRLQGHPAVEEDLPGVRIASGSLGQGLSVAIGAALASQPNRRRPAGAGWRSADRSTSPSAIQSISANSRKARFGKQPCLLPTTRLTT